MLKQVLDHGYVCLIESWGSDQAIIEAARMSTQKGFLGWFMQLRSTAKNPSAQWEIQQYANAVGVFIQQLFPRTYSLFEGGST